MGQRVDGAAQPELGECLRLAWPRPEPRTPEKPLGLSCSESPLPHGDSHYPVLSTLSDGGPDPPEMDRIPNCQLKRRRSVELDNTTDRDASRPTPRVARRS